MLLGGEFAVGRRQFRAMILLLAGVALAFFVPALIVGGVPFSRWFEFIAVAACGSTLLLGAVLHQTPVRGHRLAIGIVVAIVTAGIGGVDRGFIGQGALLFALIVAALAVMQGLMPALLAAVIGAAVGPVLIQDPAVSNLTDHVYTFIYLLGLALLPWTGVHLAERRAAAVGRELAQTDATEREAVMILGRAAAAKQRHPWEPGADDGQMESARLATELAKRAGLDASRADEIGLAVTLRDVGKLRVPDSLLRKRRSLGGAESLLVREHTLVGAEILGTSPGFAPARLVTRSHHENWDGSGYPDGLIGDQIPIEARIARVVDTWAGRRADRPGRRGPQTDPLEELARGAGTLYDPLLVPAFSELVSAGAAEPAGMSLPTREVNEQRSIVRSRRGVGRRRHRLVAAGRLLLNRFSPLIVPPMRSTAAGRDYRRVVTFVALIAVGFFVPSLLLAGVPAERWPVFMIVSFAAAVLLAGSFFSVAHERRTAIAIGVLDALAVALLGWLLGGYYHEIALLYALVVAALAVVHGLSAAVPAALLGGVLVPFAIAQPGSVNATDPVNAAIYLVGICVVPWAAARMADRQARDLRAQLEQTRSTEREAVLILARASEAKDEVTGEHVARVGDLTAELARAAGLDETSIEAIHDAAMLHDVGKLHVPDRILVKRGALTPAEWAVMRQHTIWGPEILGRSRGFSLARAIARSHHENWNGSGYPDGLRAERIPVEARMVRITDTFDALRSVRPYKAAWPLERCIDELLGGSGSAFDPELLRLFLSIVERTDSRAVTAQAAPDADVGRAAA